MNATSGCGLRVLARSSDSTLRDLGWGMGWLLVGVLVAIADKTAIYRTPDVAKADRKPMVLKKSRISCGS
ncbi:hypothetical protein [Microcoleus sp. B3-D7]|uniref:hypothetical protein n=1 Tax=Microcoleus sp. B3-D7 TaxID=2818659 RepID=UPI002FD74D5B